MMGGMWFRSKRCRCAHWKDMHRGRNTECSGWFPAGKNAVGVQQSRRCRCPAYERTERSWWQVRITQGTEDYEARRAEALRKGSAW